MRSETKLPPLSPSASAARDIADDSDADASSSGRPSTRYDSCSCCAIGGSENSESSGAASTPRTRAPTTMPSVGRRTASMSTSGLGDRSAGEHDAACLDLELLAVRLVDAFLHHAQLARRRRRLAGFLRDLDRAAQAAGQAVAIQAHVVAERETYVRGERPTGPRRSASSPDSTITWSPDTATADSPVSRGVSLARGTVTEPVSSMPSRVNVRSRSGDTTTCASTVSTTSNASPRPRFGPPAPLPRASRGLRRSTCLRRCAPVRRPSRRSRRRPRARARRPRARRWFRAKSRWPPSSASEPASCGLPTVPATRRSPVTAPCMSCTCGTRSETKSSDAMSTMQLAVERTLRERRSRARPDARARLELALLGERHAQRAFEAIVLHRDAAVGGAERERIRFVGVAAVRDVAVVAGDEPTGRRSQRDVELRRAVRRLARICLRGSSPLRAARASASSAAK